MFKTFLLVLVSLFMFNSCVTVSPKKDIQHSIATPIVAEDGNIAYGGKLFKFTNERSIWSKKENGDIYAVWIRYWVAPTDKDGEWGIMRVQTYLYKQTIGWALALGNSFHGGIIDKDCDGIFETVVGKKEPLVVFDCYVDFEQKKVDQDISAYDFNKKEGI